MVEISALTNLDCNNVQVTAQNRSESNQDPWKVRPSFTRKFIFFNPYTHQFVHDL